MDLVNAIVLCVCTPVVSTCIVAAVAVVASNATELVQHIQTK